MISALIWSRQPKLTNPCLTVDLKTGNNCSTAVNIREHKQYCVEYGLVW